MLAHLGLVYVPLCQHKRVVAIPFPYHCAHVRLPIRTARSRPLP